MKKFNFNFRMSHVEFLKIKFLKMTNFSVFSKTGFNQRAFESMMDSIFNQQICEFHVEDKNSTKYPKVDILNSDSKIRLLVEVPFLTKEDLEVKIEDGVLSISGKKRETQEFEGFEIVRKEIKRSSFVRKWTLPETLNPKTISSEFKDGYLILDIEKFISDSEKNFSVEIK